MASAAVSLYRQRRSRTHALSNVEKKQISDLDRRVGVVERWLMGTNDPLGRPNGDGFINIFDGVKKDVGDTKAAVARVEKMLVNGNGGHS